MTKHNDDQVMKILENIIHYVYYITLQVTEMVEHDPSLDKDLIAVIKQFRDDEQNHLDLGLAHGAENAPMYSLLTKIINFGCRNAIWISEKI